jgi:pimeloyl-ACP methyl ester carboxylesterase
MKKIFLISLLAIMLLAQCAITQKDIAGNWQGMLNMGPMKSRVVLKISRGYGDNWNAKAITLDIGILSATMDSVILQDSNIKLIWDNGQSHCEGNISADSTSIQGVCTLGQFSFPVSFQRATKETAWKIDESMHSTRFITVDKNVKLEVLDWGGNGRTLILLAGLGDDAHVFDKFGPKLVNAGYHVYGITRRGFGESSIPKSGYSADRLGDDVFAVMKALKLDRPVLVGHSIAGEEMSSIGSRHHEKVAGLVYLDAAYIYAYCDSSLSDRFSSIQKQLLADLKAAKLPTPRLLINAGYQKYTDIKAPLLAIYASKSVEGNESILEAIKRNIPSAKLVILPNAEHIIYLSNEDEVLNEIRAFVDNLP